MAMSPPPRIEILDVGSRDGLQNESTRVRTADKAKHAEVIGEDEALGILAQAGGAASP
jgi:isopropylmalate/homocitrate/citramalate synthase